MNSANNSVSKTQKPLVKRRKFFFLFGVAAVGLMALSKSPLKLIGSALGLGNSKQAKNEPNSGTAKGRQGIIVTENLYAVKRETKKDAGNRLNG